MNKNYSFNKRFGGVAVTIIVLLVIVGAAVGGYYGYAYNRGKEAQEKQAALWTEAFTYFSQKQPEAAYLKLVDARSTFNESLDFYRKVTPNGNYLAKSDVNEAIVLICQSEAYDTLFKLESAENWVAKAKAEVANIESAETKNELSKFIDRAEAADKLCKTYREYVATESLPETKYQELVKNSLKIGSEAVKSNDTDFVVFEIRFLIACGKAFNEPILISEARKQLFDLTSAVGEDEKTKLLWSLLRE